MRIVSWTGVALLAALWTLGAFVLHAALGWAAGASVAAALPPVSVPTWLLQALPADVAAALDALLTQAALAWAEAAEALQAAWPWAAVALGWLGWAVWAAWALGMVLLLALGAALHAVLARVPRRAHVPAGTPAGRSAGTSA